MSAENRPAHHTYPSPSREETEEMAFGSAFRRIVDDLFTDQAIAERLQALNGGDTLEALVENWKQGLTEHLARSARLSVENVAAILDMLQNGEPASLILGEQEV